MDEMTRLHAEDARHDRLRVWVWAGVALTGWLAFLALGAVLWGLASW